MGISWIRQIRAVSVTMKFLVVASALVAAISAEADPQLLYGGYAGYAGYPYAIGYGLGLKSAPCVNAVNIPVPCAGKRKRDADADPALLYGGYADYGYGLGYYGKRDAEADPQLLYGGYGGYAGYPYAHGITHPSNLGLCVNYLGAQVPC